MLQKDKNQEFTDKDLERYKLAIQGLDVGLWDWDVISGREYWSPRLLEMMGINEPNYIPTRDAFTSRLHPDDLLKVMEAVQRHFDQKEPFVIEYRVKHQEGHFIWVLAKGQAKWNEGGEPVRMIGSVEDITEKRITREKLHRTVENLNEFTYIVSHDLKEPLRGILNYAQFLLEDHESEFHEDVTHKLRTIIDLSQRAQGFIDALLKCSNIGQVENTAKNVDLNDLVKAVVQNIDFRLKEANAEVIVKEKLPLLMCDPVRIAEVFQNLILNGVKYNDSESKKIEISCEPAKSGGYIFSVSDNGIGIEEKHRESVFKIFRRLHGREQYGGGSGAGLAIVKKIIERHDGQLWLQSEIGKGTTFYFTIADICTNNNS